MYGTGGTYFSGSVTGLSPGKHGFHVHESDDIHGGCEGAGNHFHTDPENNVHGSPEDKATEKHAGDFGNIIADGEGTANINFGSRSVNLFSGKKNIVGKSLVVYEQEDDFEHAPVGGRIACCSI